jgi:Protein of unknown function (DUF3710)
MMALRRREKRTSVSKLDATPPWPVRERPEPEATTGPYDIRDAPDDDLVRVDFGGLQVPAPAGLELRYSGDNDVVVSVVLVNATGQMELGVFAAPRSNGIWAEVRTELAEAVREQGGTAKESEGGPFGVELVGSLKVDGARTPVRYIGIDGPRWMLRAVLLGAVATDAVKARPFEAALRNVVVSRGSQPLPVRDQVPLRPPNQALPEPEEVAE